MNKIGIISGSGRLPVLIAQAAVGKGIEVYAGIFTCQPNNGIKKFTKNVIKTRLGKLLPIIEYFKQNGVTNIAMAGIIPHNRIFANLELDEVMKNVLASAKDKKADSLLGGFADEFSRHGLIPVSMIDLLPDNIAKQGIIAGPEISGIEQEYTRFGLGISKELSKYDIGQTIVIKEKAVIAVEAMEGTDNCILRAGRIAGKDCIIIKTAKFNQDCRFDLPVIGIKTIKNLRKIKSHVLIIESGKTIILDKEEVIRLAGKYGITIFGK